MGTDALDIMREWNMPVSTMGVGVTQEGEAQRYIPPDVVSVGNGGGGGLPQITGLGPTTAFAEGELIPAGLWAYSFQGTAQQLLDAMQVFDGTGTFQQDGVTLLSLSTAGTPPAGSNRTQFFVSDGTLSFGWGPTYVRQILLG